MIALHPAPRIFGALFLVAPMLAPAYAKVVSYNFTARTHFIGTSKLGEISGIAVTSFDVPNIGTVAIGDIITGTLTYDTNSRLENDEETDNEVDYLVEPTEPMITYRIGNIGRQFSFGEFQYIGVTDRREGDERGDEVFFYGASPNFVPNPEYGVIILRGSQFLDSTRPPDHLSINGIPNTSFQIRWNLPDLVNELYQNARITSLTPVPEPSAFALVGAGLGMFWLCRAAASKRGT